MGIIKFSTVDEMGIDQMGVDQEGINHLHWFFKVNFIWYDRDTLYT